MQAGDAGALELLRPVGSGPVRAVAVGPSGRAVAGDNLGIARLWLDGASPSSDLSGHLGPITAVDFSRTGELVVTGGADRTVRLWHAASGRPVAVLRGLNGEVMAVRFSADGTEVAGCDGDAVVAVWSVGGGQPRRRIPCRRASPMPMPDGGIRPWQVEALRHDWESIRCGCRRGARHVPGSFAELVRAQTEEEASGRGLVNDVEIQGMLFEAAVPVTSMILAALAEEPLSLRARQRMLDLLLACVDGESHHSEALEGRTHLAETCRERARTGMSVLHREMRDERIPGSAAFVREILDCLD
ncbi:hypothetical protein ABT336_21260 [Micromonospora sp. NPDC000207]|uniref:WD40 repeat domain-containing protein n=1 Tax=Micromonospora sp. NPDC000207 TaxID=3154246 RepID=UPI003333C451